MNKLEYLIRKAFNCTESLDSMTIEDARAWNQDIVMVDYPSIIKIFPMLMMKEMYDKSRVNGDCLIRFLDGALLKKDKLGNFVPRDKKIHEFDYRYTNDQFKDFTKEQAQVIVRWLKQVAKQKYWKDYSVPITSAIIYWKSKYVNTGIPKYLMR